MIEFIHDHGIATYVIYFLWLFGGFGWIYGIQQDPKKCELTAKRCAWIHLLWPLVPILFAMAFIVEAVTGKEADR